MLPSVSRSPLLPAAYHDPQVLEQEQMRTFERHWLFAGLAEEIAHPNQYLAAAFGRESVMVQNFEGVLKAFRNVCSHRGARLRDHGCGQGVLRCRYHGWTYDAGGLPVGIPHNHDNFGCDARDRASLALTSYAIGQAGPFVFVRLAGHGPSLTEYLGPALWELFEQLSAGHRAPFVDETETWQANWKLAVENTLESYHLSAVHGESLGSTVVPEGVHRGAGRHSTTQHELQEASARWWRGVVQRGRFARLSGFDDYRHYFVYPNLCLGLTYGTLLSVQHFQPLSANSCLLRFRLLLPAAAEEVGRGPDTAADDGAASMRTAVADYLREFNRRVLDEDRGLVELCQLGTGGATQPALFGANELRVRALHEALAADLAPEPKCDRPTTPTSGATRP